MNINAVLTNNEKLKNFNGQLLDKDCSTQILTEWINKDNILKYENIIHKLKLENITQEQFSTILNCKEDIYNLDIQTMEWYKIYNEIINFYKDNNKFELYDYNNVFYFLNIFINWAKIKIDNEINKYNNIQISKDCVIKMLINVGLNLTNICSKTIIYEYYNQNYKVFKEFNIKNFNNIKNTTIFLEKYPVMLRRLCIKTKHVVENYLESLKRIDEDYMDIKLVHNISSLITNIKGNLGDTHAGGKFVVEYEFNNNTKIIYKPKNLFIAKKFYELLSWINKTSNLEKLAIPRNYYNDFYTIEEYIDIKQCENYDEVKRYYKRIGQLIGLTYHLKGNDFHHENIIASGEHPYLIDLETLFVHSFKDNIEDVFDVISLNYEESINAMSFLPSNTAFMNKNGQGIDISALSYKDQKLPFKILQLVGDINNPKFEYKEFNVKSQNNIPLVNNIKIDYRNYKNDIVEGFNDINIFILENKVDFLDKLNIFKDIKVRQLMRNTYEYSKILEYSSHPKYTSNMQAFEKTLYTLWNSVHLNKSMVTSEIEDMILDDIPIFNTITTSKDLIDSRNNIIKDYFKTSGFEYVINKINNFNYDILNKQIDYLNISLNNSKYLANELNRKNNDLFNITLYNNFNLNFNLDLEHLAIEVYKLIEEKSIIYNDECIIEHYFESSIQLNFNYRNGLAGTLKYLFELNKITKDPINILEKIIKTLLNKKVLLSPQFKSIE
ncbi:TPA: type 2 lantipeptide synthetase LanM, partial [Clostridium perfringens]|nr:type 2 lantipeptide synthetase LanM [Clostridium perfringens]